QAPAKSSRVSAHLPDQDLKRRLQAGRRCFRIQSFNGIGCPFDVSKQDRDTFEFADLCPATNWSLPTGSQRLAASGTKAGTSLIAEATGRTSGTELRSATCAEPGFLLVVGITDWTTHRRLRCPAYTLPALAA